LKGRRRATDGPRARRLPFDLTVAYDELDAADVSDDPPEELKVVEEPLEDVVVELDDDVVDDVSAAVVDAEPPDDVEAVGVVVDEPRIDETETVVEVPAFTPSSSVSLPQDATVSISAQAVIAIRFEGFMGIVLCRKRGSVSNALVRSVAYAGPSLFLQLGALSSGRHLAFQAASSGSLCRLGFG
jgi:hypothetical protein